MKSCQASRMSRPRIVHLLALCALTLFVSAPHAQQPAQPQPQQQQPAPPPQQTPPPGDAQPQAAPTFRTGINYVRVDAFVTDKKGDMVLDLKKEDFDVSEDNKP